MAVELEIQDGNPWWMSPDLWAVPGIDPESPPGSPIVGQPCYLWARVRNNGSSTATNATVRYYWANPAVGFDRSTANLIGSSYVTLEPGEARDVLCLTPWHPEFVNNGHECILGEAFLPGVDPILNTPVFNVPTDRHVAQRNLSVVTAARMMFMFSFAIHNPQRKPGKFQLRVETGNMEQLKPLQRHLGVNFQLPELTGNLVKHAFIPTPCATDSIEETLQQGSPLEPVQIEAGQRTGMTLIGQITEGAVLIHIEQIADEATVGGISVLVLPDAT
ncbi:hypothetical protein MKJ04_14545 [Pontibacter sp. E15-1]|uniref:hypothetical protein n=1 Tax=Pontibacter sp. E15-1 TaxID=2919918 RepID=UPI001F500A4B|nr:hypothetical protein [Pontibacter sp. E15-1]MCJ8166063.1 hypothetical protein [Pontibacter sp. E15-1]